MDYKRTLLRFIFILFAIIIMSGCDTEISPEPLRITGDPPETLYYGSEFVYNFGASGGDGVYRYRYIQKPELDADSVFEDNPVEMNIEVLDGARPRFRLRGIPILPENAIIEEINSQKYTYQIELTDGKNTITRDFEFTLKQNKLKFVNVTSVREGVTSNQALGNLKAQLKSGNIRVCNDVKENDYESYQTKAGEYVYPLVLQVVADAPVTTRTELFYQYETSYNESLTERSKRNTGYARKNVDYIDAIKSVVLEPGQATCIASIDILDDKIIEDNELVTVQFYKQIGRNFDISSARVIIDIVDDEIKPEYVSKQVVRNAGDNIVVPLTLTRSVDYPVTVNVSVDLDEEKTTATESDYKIEPSSGVIVFQPGEVEASYTVSLLKNNTTSTDSAEDKIITLNTDIDFLIDVDEPYTIQINEWSDTVDIDSEIVGSSANNEEVIDFISDGDNVISILLRSNSATNQTAKLRSFSRNSAPFNFSTTGDYEFSKIGVNVLAQSIVHESSSNDSRVAVILNVDGLFGDIYRGKTDFVVAIFQKETGGVFTLESVNQFGTEGDDIVSGAKIKNGALYVYGKTNGLKLEGASGFESNNGGEDGFLYALNLSTNTLKWARFIGTNSQDNLVSIDVNNKDIVALVSTLNNDEDAFIRKLSSSNGLDIIEDGPIEISTIRNDKPVSIRLDSSGSNYRVLFESDSDLNFVDKPTPSLSKDVQLLPYDSKNEKGSSIAYATDQEDFAKSLESTPKKLNLIISGETFGAFNDNVKKGSEGKDIFTAVLKSEGSNSLVKSSNIQFGSPADDNLISVKAINDTKYFALWSEAFTDPNNIVYRISAFSVDGKKLSRDPE